MPVADLIPPPPPRFFLQLLAVVAFFPTSVANGPPIGPVVFFLVLPRCPLFGHLIYSLMLRFLCRRSVWRFPQSYSVTFLFFCRDAAILPLDWQIAREDSSPRPSHHPCPRHKATFDTDPTLILNGSPCHTWDGVNSRYFVEAHGLGGHTILPTLETGCRSGWPPPCFCVEVSRVRLPLLRTSAGFPESPPTPGLSGRLRAFVLSTLVLKAGTGLSRATSLDVCALFSFSLPSALSSAPSEFLVQP